MGERWCHRVWLLRMRTRDDGVDTFDPVIYIYSRSYEREKCLVGQELGEGDLYPFVENDIHSKLGFL